MSNLAFVKLEPSNEYQDLSTLSGITFTAGSKYTLQVKGSVIFCEQSQLPTEEGFVVNNTNPFELIAGSDAVYVKALQPFGDTDTATINIAN